MGRGRATAKISGCWVYTISRRGIVQLGSPFHGSIFLLFPMTVAKTMLIVARENPQPPALGDSPGEAVSCQVTRVFIKNPRSRRKV